MRRNLAALAFALFLLVEQSSPLAAAQTGDGASASERGEIEALVEAHTENTRIQTERPDFQPEPREPPDRSRNGFLEAIGKFFAWLFGNFGWLFRFILIAAVAAVVGYAFWYMFGGLTLPGRRRKQTQVERDISAQSSQRPGNREAKALLAQADALAAEGRFAEAVHLLLFRSIEVLRDRRSDGVSPSLTAREIQSLSDLSDRTRRALSPIIGLVERSFFGGRPVDRSGWQTARASYEDFAFGEAAA